MQIELTAERYARLTLRAAEAGFANVEEFIVALADDAGFDPRGGMTDGELRQSAAECAEIHDRMAGGQEHDAREALAGLGKKYGLQAPL
jgi:hypothetical protein